jgi:serine/threonine protein phosphatase 1
MKFVVADIHGEISKLHDLITHILSVDDQPFLIFIGDYMDKGESSYEVLRYLVILSKHYECVFLIGNHEYIWMNLYEDFEKYSSYLIKYGGINTIESLGCKTVESARERMLNEFADFFQNLDGFWADEEFVVVHSGILPEDYNKRPEDIPLERLLFNRYDFIKHEHLYLDKYKVVFGHTGFYNPYIDPYKVGIDTSACYIEYQPLTAFCLTNHTFYDSNGLVKKANFEALTLCPVIPRVKPWRMK